MTLAMTLLLLLLLVFLGVLPVWPFSREWGTGPAIFIGTVVLVLVVMALMGQVPGWISPPRSG
jgi:hypothetical protein